MHFENLQTASGSGPFLEAFLKADRVWDKAAKTEWADDVELRLREVAAQIDPNPTVLGYTIQRVKNCVTIYTVTPHWQTKQNMAALWAGQWPRWGKIIKAVPEMVHSSISFDASTNWEWARKWDVEHEMSRFRSENGIFE